VVGLLFHRWYKSGISWSVICEGSLSGSFCDCDISMISGEDKGDVIWFEIRVKREVVHT